MKRQERAAWFVADASAPATNHFWCSGDAFASNEEIRNGADVIEEGHQRPDAFVTSDFARQAGGAGRTEPPTATEPQRFLPPITPPLQWTPVHASFFFFVMIFPVWLPKQRTFENASVEPIRS